MERSVTAAVDNLNNIEKELTAQKIQEKFNIGKEELNTTINMPNYINGLSKNNSKKLGINKNFVKNSMISDTKELMKNVKKTAETIDDVATVAKLAIPGEREIEVASKVVKKGVKKKVNKQKDRMNVVKDSASANKQYRSKFLKKLEKKLPGMDKASFFQDDYNEVDFGESMESKVRKKILSCMGMCSILIIILLLFFLVVLILTSPIAFFVGAFDENIKEDPNYVVTAIDDKNQRFQDMINEFKGGNEYNEVNYWDKNKYNNSNDIIAAYLSIMCSKNLQSIDDIDSESDTSEITQDFLIVDKPEEIKTLDEVYNQFNYVEKSTTSKTVQKQVPVTIPKIATVKSNLIKQHPLSSGYGKKLEKEYFYDYKQGMYFKVFGNYLTADLLDELNLRWIEDGRRTVTFDSGNQYNEMIGHLEYVGEEIIYEVETKNVDCEIMTVYHIDLNQWKFKYIDNYDELTKEFLEMMEEFTNSSNLDIGGNLSQEALSDPEFMEMYKVFKEECEGLPYDMARAGYPSQGAQYLDCSCFVSYIIDRTNLLGRPFARTTTNPLMEMCDTFTDYNQLKPGDLIFFQKTYKENGDWYPGASHVAIYTGDGNMMHSGNPCKEVRFIDNSYWQEHFLCYGRIRK